MAKFKVGDMVRIREDLERTDKGAGVTGEMLRFRGRICKVTKVDCSPISSKTVYRLGPDELRPWFWNDWMLEPVAKPVHFNFEAATEKEAIAKVKAEFEKASLRQWTKEDAARARKETLEIVGKFLEDCNGIENIVFSSTSEFQDKTGKNRITTKASIVLTGGLYPLNSTDQNMRRLKNREGVAYLREGENNEPWIGRLVAVRKLLGKGMPDWF